MVIIVILILMGWVYKQDRKVFNDYLKISDPIDYHAVLNVSSNATYEEIKKAYRLASKIYHPDKALNDNTATEKFINITNAYKILTDKY